MNQDEKTRKIDNIKASIEELQYELSTVEEEPVAPTAEILHACILSASDDGATVDVAGGVVRGLGRVHGGRVVAFFNRGLKHACSAEDAPRCGSCANFGGGCGYVIGRCSVLKEGGVGIAVNESFYCARWEPKP